MPSSLACPDNMTIIIGAGHNALTTAFYLAKAGRNPLVLERRDVVGGADVTETSRRASGAAGAPSGRCAPRSCGTCSWRGASSSSIRIRG